MRWIRRFCESFFCSTFRVVEDNSNEDRSNFVWGGKGGRSFGSESTHTEKSTADEFLDGSKSRLDYLEVKEGTSKVVSNFFETKDELGASDSANNFSGIRDEIEALEVKWVDTLGTKVVT